MTVSYSAREDFSVSVVLAGRSAPRVRSFGAGQAIDADTITAMGADRVALFIKSGELLTTTTLPTLEIDQVEAEALEYTIGTDPAWAIAGGLDADAFTITDGVLGLTAQTFGDEDDSDSDGVFEVTLSHTDAEGHSYSQAVEVTITEA